MASSEQLPSTAQGRDPADFVVQDAMRMTDLQRRKQGAGQEAAQAAEEYQ
jgi:hypothetical protein